jgi:hypothetical protein
MQLDMWDYLTFLCFFILGIGFLATIVFVLGLPGRIARARNHPEADAINMMGWVGFMAIVPWMQAFLWAFKPTDVIDIRRFPREEKKALEEEARKYAEANAPREKKKKPAPPTPKRDENQ